MIEAEKATYTVKRMCECLEVSRSGYYKWRKSRERGPTPAQQRRAELDAKVAKFHAASDGVYGAPRILADLRDDGERVSRKTVAASLRRQGLAGICPGGSRRPPRWLTSMLRCLKTWSSVVSTPGSSTGCGPRISSAVRRCLTERG
ncbi:HTH-like domain protein [Mycobacterium xenopi 3993]|nr:HTH-like domain protein [Mycobacterium xenopi 3993]